MSPRRMDFPVFRARGENLSPYSILELEDGKTILPRMDR